MDIIEDVKYVELLLIWEKILPIVIIVIFVVKDLIIIVHGQLNALAQVIVLNLNYFYLVFLYLFVILEYLQFGLILIIINVILIFSKFIPIISI